MLRQIHGLAALLALTPLATAQLPRSATGRLIPADPALVQAPVPVPVGTTAAAAVADAQPAAPSQLLQQLQRMSFDRRPSAFLAAWARPEPKPFDEDPEFDEARKEIADLEAEIAATPVPAPPDPNAKPVETAGPEDAAKADDAAKAEDAAKAGADAKPTEGAPPVAGADPSAQPTPVVPPHPKQAELDAKKAALEARRVHRELELFARDVTLGRWDRVAARLAAMPGKEGPQAYALLLRKLPALPVKPQNNRIPANLLEQNTFTFQDVVGIASAAPDRIEEGIEEDAQKTNLKLLVPVLRRALDAGHAVEELLALLHAEAAKPDGEGVFTRREAARLLAGLSRDTELGEFLPTADEAEASDDREALNLLSRFYLALHRKEQKTVHLENAWKVTLAALAAGEVEEAEKAEALRRAVELAPKIREELGDAWLEESFTDRPERGMEIIAAIGAQASKGFETHPTQTDFRLEGLQLQKTAIDALLATAPERAESWRISLNLLAANWLAEAIFSYANSQATTMGPIIQRDPYGNIFYRNYRSNYRGPVWALEPGDLLKIRPDGAWVAKLDASVRPRFSTVVAELYLKVNEETKAFPFIEALAATHPAKAKELAEEFLRVWTRNHNPNVANNRTDPYMFIYGFDQRANAIPLTRSKQERNLAELAEWIAKLRVLPIDEIDQKLVVNAFTASHSTAEVYRLETIEKVFGSLESLEPKTIAEMVQKMRTNLVGVWRQPNTQRQNKTNRKQKDIEREVLGGYETASRVVMDALAKHGEDWRLLAALAALGHDRNNYAQDIEKSSEFTSRRAAALDGLQAAAESYAAGVESLSLDEETIEPYQLWFYASLGACDLQFVDERTQLEPRQPAKIRAAIDALPGEARERHMTKFANALFTRMSSVNPAVKIRYLTAGFEIVGDHPQAYEARKVFDYYNDLVTEIKLETVIDGPDVVGYEQPFGVRVNLRHTREIERESGGFAKYVTNQNNVLYAYNYGRPLENYRDKFQEAATAALKEHFEVLSVTFNGEDIHSKAAEEYGWRITPYAYLLLKARGPEVDKIPSLRLDLDFLDTSGYAVIPVASPAVPLDATAEPTVPSPFHDLEVTQILDERRAEDGELVLEIKATAKGLVPGFDEILTLDPAEFDIEKVDDQGVAVSRFDDEQKDIVSERVWTVSMKAAEGLAGHPETFEFASVLDESAKTVYQRYADADLTPAERVISLEERYGDPSVRWPWFVGLGALLLGGAWLGFSRLGRSRGPAPTGRRLPETITPFSVLGLLRDIERENGFGPELERELTAAIERIERCYFGPTAEEEPDLRRIAEEWVGRAG